MPFPYYQTDGIRLAAPPNDLTLSPISQRVKNETYVAHPDLAAAVNVAMLLGQPLLVTGEPGTGKTQLAHSLNWKLGFKNANPLSFETKSTSTARDLFYTYDAIGRFHAAQTAQINFRNANRIDAGGIDSTDPADDDDAAAYITYNPLGLAILLANPWETARHFLPFRELGGEAQFEKIKSLEQFKFLKDGGLAEWQRRSVVLIDEIDKAPRDFPNDILNEIDRMFFRVTELSREISVVEEDYQMRPIVILTSNSEKNLPDAFLRRCVYYHIDFPKPAELREIVVSRLFPGTDGRLGNEPPPPDWLDSALGIFDQIRRQNLVKKPATAELLGWLTAIRSKPFRQDFDDFQTLSKTDKQNFVNATLNILIKNETDRKKVQSLKELKIPGE